MSEWSASLFDAGVDKNWQENLETKLSSRDWSQEISPIVEKLRLGVRLSIEDGKFLFHYQNLTEIGLLANLVKQSRFGDNVYFNSNI